AGIFLSRSWALGSIPGILSRSSTRLSVGRIRRILYRSRHLRGKPLRRLPLRPKRAALQAAQAFAPDALLPDNPRSPTCPSGLPILRRVVWFYSALDTSW